MLSLRICDDHRDSSAISRWSGDSRRYQHRKSHFLHLYTQFPTERLKFPSYTIRMEVRTLRYPSQPPSRPSNTCTTISHPPSLNQSPSAQAKLLFALFVLGLQQLLQSYHTNQLGPLITALIQDLHPAWPKTIPRHKYQSAQMHKCVYTPCSQVFCSRSGSSILHQIS